VMPTHFALEGGRARGGQRLYDVDARFGGAVARTHGGRRHQGGMRARSMGVNQLPTSSSGRSGAGVDRISRGR
jgi:hypothetical protein